MLLKLHPQSVHFPIAFWSFATLGDIASLKFGEQLLWITGVMLVLGTMTALVTMLTGLIEFGKISEQSPATQIANQHMKLALATWVLYAASLFMRLEGTTLTKPGIIAICLSSLGFLFLTATGWFGGKLVYKFKVGVEEE